MQLKWLEDFIVLAQERSFTRAAELRHVTHPAFGRRIRALEAWAGTPLVERGGGPVTLTPAGQSFLDTAGQMVRNLTQSHEELQSLAGRQARTVTLATGRTLARTVVADWLVRLQPILQGGELCIRTRALADTVAMLERSEADFSLVYHHPTLAVRLDARQFMHVTVASDRLVPVSRATAQGPLDFNTRKNMRQTQVGLAYDFRVDAANALRLMVYAGQRHITQYQSTPVAAQKPATSAGGVIDLGRDYGGMDLRWAHDAQLADAPLNLVLGLAANVVEEDRQGYNNFLGKQLGVMGALRRDERNTLNNADPYLQASWAFAPRWKLDAGLRWSNVKFVSRDHYIVPGNGDDSGSTRFRRWLPMLSLQHALNAATQVYASVGGGMETPTFNEISYRPGGLPGLNFGLQPATSTSAEIGLRQRIAGDVLRGQWTAALFHTDTKNEIVAADNTGGRATYRNAGRTRRQGAELATQLQLARQWQLNAALTVLDAKLRDGICDSKGSCVPAGKRIAGTARTQAAIGLDWRPHDDWRIGADWRHVSAIAANDSNSAQAPGYGVLALSTGYTRQWGPWKLNAFARIDNLADKKYVGSVIVNEGNGRYYEAAPGRQWMAGMSLGYQF